MKERLVDVNELSEYLGNVKVGTIYSWVSQKRIPYVKIGALLRFDIKCIDKWIEENVVEVYIER